MEDILGLILIIGVPVMLIFLVLRYRYKSKAKTVELVKTLIENDKEVPPEMMKAVTIQSKKRHGDLLLSMILFASSFGIIAFGAAIPHDPNASSIFAGIAMLPMFVGLAMLLFWYFVSRKDDYSS